VLSATAMSIFGSGLGRPSQAATATPPGTCIWSIQRLWRYRVSSGSKFGVQFNYSYCFSQALARLHRTLNSTNHRSSSTATQFRESSHQRIDTVRRLLCRLIITRPTSRALSNLQSAGAFGGASTSTSTFDSLNLLSRHRHGAFAALNPPRLEFWLGATIRGARNKQVI